jgi:DNA-binding CsgD family transcriptional regulator
MVTAQIKKLEAAKARLARLQDSIASQLQKELAGLPAAYGFDSVREFAAAVAAASSGKRRGRAAGESRKSAAGKRRKRAVITDATRATVKKLTEAGKTGAQIAKTAGISLPSVQNIKKALGLVKARK